MNGVIEASGEPGEPAEIYKGYELPPDNDELFEDVWRTVPTYYDDGRIEVSCFRTTLTNREARECNIRFIDEGKEPLYIHWSDISAPEAAASMSDRFKKASRNLLGAIFAPKTGAKL